MMRLRRIAYLKSYRSYREKQVAVIHETQDLIAKRQKQQLVRKDQKNKALENQLSERNELSEQRKEKDVVVSKLKSQEKDLEKQIAAKKKRDRDLQNAITAIVRREIDAAKKAEEERVNKATRQILSATPGSTNATANAAAKKPESYLELNAVDVELGADFSNNRGKLPWPVDNGFVKIPLWHIYN